MSDARCVIYTPCPDATLESEAAALASVYRFVLDCHAKKKAAGAGSNNVDEAKGSKHEVHPTRNHSR